MKLIINIIVGTSIMLAGLTPAFGFSLLRGKTSSVNRWPYSFGDRYIYDNGGLSWNYDSHHKHGGSQYRPGHRHDKHRHLRFESTHKRPEDEKLDRLIKHFTRK